MKLREELEALISPPSITYEWIDEEPRKIEQLKQQHSHDIELYEPARKDAPYHNCYMYALGVAYDDIDEPGQILNSKFIRQLIEDGILENLGDSSTAPDGAIIIYLDESEMPVHAGIKSGNKVISKWGYGYTHVWRHAAFEAPASYGDRVKLFRPPAKDVVLRKFARWDEEQDAQQGI